MWKNRSIGQNFSFQLDLADCNLNTINWFMQAELKIHFLRFSTKQFEYRNFENTDLKCNFLNRMRKFQWRHILEASWRIEGINGIKTIERRLVTVVVFFSILCGFSSVQLAHTQTHTYLDQRMLRMWCAHCVSISGWRAVCFVNTEQDCAGKSKNLRVAICMTVHGTNRLDYIVSLISLILQRKSWHHSSTVSNFQTSESFEQHFLEFQLIFSS